MNEPIQGSFYASELQKVSKDEQTQWSIEKIIRKRKVGGKPEVLVQWLGWPKKFDSWIPEIDVKNIWHPDNASFIIQMSLQMVLKSSYSASTHSDNKPWNFRVRLPRSLPLTGEWTVELTEFCNNNNNNRGLPKEIFVYCSICENTIKGNDKDHFPDGFIWQTLKIRFFFALTAFLYAIMTSLTCTSI